MAVIDRLLSAGVHKDDANRAAAATAAVLPVDRNVRLTEKVLDAARAGDVALLSMLLAQEVDALPEELAALEAADEANDGRRFTQSEVRTRLAL